MSMEVQLEFANQAFVELLSADGLAILARYVLIILFFFPTKATFYATARYRGLGLDGLFLKFLKLYSDPHNLVLVLNTSGVLEVRVTCHEEAHCLYYSKHEQSERSQTRLLVGKV